MEGNMDLKKIIITVIPFVLLAVAFSVLRAYFSGTTPYIQLSDKASPYGQVSQFLAATSGDGTPTNPPQDFSLTSTKYLENNTWVVTDVTKPTDTSSSGTLVLQKKNGLFVIAIGPGTAFNANDLLTLPVSVSTYLTEKGVVYGP